MTSKQKLLSFSIIIMTVSLVLSAMPATANGVPVKIFLNYLPDLSNYGPPDANGIATVSIGEAWVELTADGMPVLTNEQYEAWITTADQAQMTSLGTFNADNNNHIEYFAEFENIPVLDYQYFIISVEAVPDPSPEIDSRWVIAGIFPNPELQIVTSTPTPANAAGELTETDNTGGVGPEENQSSTGTSEIASTPTPLPPATLPVTGQVSSFELTLFILGVSMMILSLLLLKFARK